MEEMQKKKPQKICRTKTGRVFSSKFTTPCMSFEEALRGRTGNSSSLRHIRWQWQVPPQWNPGSLLLYSKINSRQQVSQFGHLM
jgi:hypothetical protein